MSYSSMPVYVVNPNMKLFNDIHDDNFCNEVLENMKTCLHKCRDNKTVFNVNPHIFDTINIDNCEQIQKFKNELQTTKTIVEIKNPLLTPRSRYSIEYVVNKRLLVVDNFNNGPNN
jgi:hypothetical protein